jgi:hypothetical protein
MKTQVIEGKTVNVMCYGGNVASVFVFRDLGEVLMVCRPEEMEAAKRESRDPVTVGFKRESLAEKPY